VVYTGESQDGKVTVEVSLYLQGHAGKDHFSFRLHRKAGMIFVSIGIGNLGIWIACCIVEM
jgi:hypothetical protein